MNPRLWSPFLLAIFFVACHTTYRPVSAVYQDYSIRDSLPQDQTLENMLLPYSDSLNQKMGVVIGNLESTLTHKTPEGSLGDFAADAMLAEARKQFGRVDAAVVNSGGVRLNELTAGPISLGKVYELMPFDNLVVVQELSGTVLKEFLNHTVKRGGWPMAGIQMTIKEGAATDISIGGKPLDLTKDYFIANTDYVANGGDNCVMLKPIPQKQNGSLFRDAIRNYIEEFTAAGKKIPMPETGRITNVQ